MTQSMPSAAQDRNNTARASYDSLYRSMNPSPLAEYYLPAENSAEGDSEARQYQNTTRLVDFMQSVSQPGPAQEAWGSSVVASSQGTHGRERDLIPSEIVDKMISMERRARQAFRTYGKWFPPAIWTCCSRQCFTRMAVENNEVFLEVLSIHEISESYHRRIESLLELVPTRRRGIGGSDLAFSAPTRAERESYQGITDRQKVLRQLSLFACEVLPFLYGKKDAPNGTKKPGSKFCSEAICCILGVSRNFLYKRRKWEEENAAEVSEVEVLSIVDTADVRLHQHRRNGRRLGYPSIDDMPGYNCGCEQPCFAETNVWRLHKEYKAFTSLAGQISPRKKEHRYLLKAMFCPLMNTSVALCDKAVAALYTVSPSVISDVRMVLHKMCESPDSDENVIAQRRSDGYLDMPRHPMNRYSQSVRDTVETHLEMIIRPDPGASDGVNVCRVYSPEINTQEKLRGVISRYLQEDEGINVTLSASTMQRMINDYLRERSCRISFTQSDHNACPNCKTIKYALLQFSFDIKAKSTERMRLMSRPRPFTLDQQRELDEEDEFLRVKRYQESTALNSLREHNERDASIRKFLKRATDYFRRVENSDREMGMHRNGRSMEWRMRHDHGMITHQDDMSKADLPSFIVTASSDITRWRYDVNAHVNSVTNESIVYSHEQGGGAKTGSTTAEQIILDHLVRCRGEGVKIIVSDNASVGKNWLNVVALPQYLVDQGLAEVALVVFLENNHGKWLADMLFGQLKTRKRRSTVLGIDGLLREFEEINQKGGSVKGFAVNPLSSVDWYKVFSSLGYGTKPPKDFGFTRRNIHFAAACAPGAKDRLPTELKVILGNLLPTEPGMVRLCSDPPDGIPDAEREYEKRHFDVPAASQEVYRPFLDGNNGISGAGYSIPETQSDAPLVVPLSHPYGPSGSGLVSSRNMDKVGFNGIEFRSSNACPELRNRQSRVVQEAWPVALIDSTHDGDIDEHEQYAHVPACRRCAPENWVVRQPVSHFATENGRIVARYPPRNMLNAKARQPPRLQNPWQPVQTYYEPPFPICQASSRSAMKEVASKHSNCNDTINVLDLLYHVFKHMGAHQSETDPWLQCKVSIPERRELVLFEENLHLDKQRQTGHPSPPITVRQAFSKDAQVVEQAREKALQTQPSRLEQRTVKRIISEMFKEAEVVPGKLDQYEAVVERDLERYASELQFFKEVTQRTFDEEHGLLPVLPLE